jgi:hypothetical protein
MVVMPPMVVFVSKVTKYPIKYLAGPTRDKCGLIHDIQVLQTE